MAAGDIGAAYIDNEEFEPITCWDAHCVKRTDGILCVFWTDSDTDGWLATYAVDAEGNIGDTPIATLEFETQYCFTRQNFVKEVATGIFMIAYKDAAAKLRFTTVSVSADGATLAVVDSLQTAYVSVDVGGLAKHGTNRVFVAVFHESGQDGRIVSVTCDADGSNITEVDNYEFQPTRAYLPQICKGKGDYFIMSYTDTDGKGQLSSVAVANDGTITKSVTATRELDPTYGAWQIALLCFDSLLIAAYRTTAGGGRIATIITDSDGSLPAQTDAVTFDGVDASHPRLFSLGTGGSSSYFGVCYHNSASDDIYVRTFSAVTAGTLSAEIDNLKMVDSIGTTTHDGCEVQDGIWVFPFIQKASQDGWMRSVAIESISTLYPSNDLTRITGLRHVYRPGSYRLEATLGDVSTTVEIPQHERAKVEIPVTDRWRQEATPLITEIDVPKASASEVVKAMQTELEAMPELPKLRPIPENLWQWLTPWKEEEGETFGGEIIERAKSFGKWASEAWKGLFGK